MHGFYNRILTVNLSDQFFEIERLPQEVYEKYLGGKGLASYLLLSRSPKGLNPLSPDNVLIFATGPITQSTIWGSSRYGVFTKSPQTGFYSESYSGGKVPEAIDAAGYDAIMIRGRSSKPTILAIDPNGAQFHPANGVWGMDTYKAEDAVNERFSKNTSYDKKGAVVIGPASENLVSFGVIGVVLHRQFAISLFYFLFTGVFLNTKNFVIVFGHTGKIPSLRFDLVLC